MPARETGLLTLEDEKITVKSVLDKKSSTARGKSSEYDSACISKVSSQKIVAADDILNKIQLTGGRK